MQTVIPKRGRLNQIYIEKDKTTLKKLVCVWCGDIFLQPQKLYCGHTICLQCVESELQRSKRSKKSMKCMICGQQVKDDQIGQDRIANAIVQNIIVRCSSINCGWEGFNRDFSQHYNHECSNSNRMGDSRYEYRYFSNKTEFVRKLNDDQQKRQHKPNMLHPGIAIKLREKMEKEWETRLLYNEDE